MKYLKRFNENITSDNESERFQSMMDLVNTFQNEKITPATEKIPINQVYKGIVIKTVNKVDTTGLNGKHLPGVEVYTDIPKDRSPNIENRNYQTNWIYIGQVHHYSVLPGYFNLCFYESEAAVKQRVFSNFNVDFHDHLILNYNDVNHAELENLLSEFGIEVDEMWGIPR